MQFSVLAEDSQSHARLGRLDLPHGSVETPIFMPVGTYGTVKAMTPRDLTEVKAQIVLGNTFHLWLRPGLEVIKRHGGLHRFMAWNKPILTDSGGFQVFSLGALRKISAEGVTFSSPINGDKLFMSPEVSMEIQAVLNSDIAMQFDECTPYPASEKQARESMQLSLRWAKRSKDATHYQHADQHPGREVVRAGAPVGRRGAQGMTTARAARHVNHLAAAV